jgi:ParB family chromosome partitioning protein
MVLQLEEKVSGAVKELREHGLVSPYLRAFVVGRINPLRWTLVNLHCGFHWLV